MVSFFYICILVVTLLPLLFPILWHLSLTGLRFVYLRGPSSFGGWEGLPIEDVCARLTHTRSALWVQEGVHHQDCVEAVDRKVVSYIIGTMTIFVICLVYHIIQLALKYMSSCILSRMINNRHPPTMASIDTASSSPCHHYTPLYKLPSIM